MEHNFNLYHIFYTVARCKNISGAAKELFISQPAISKAISKLEQSLDTTLFLRSSRGVTLTETGEILYKQVSTAFHAIRQGEDQLKKMNELGIGHLSLGVSTTLCKYILMPYLAAFTRENPHIQISISCQSTYKTIEALENGIVDIGLIAGNERMEKLTFDRVKEIEDIFVTTKRYLENLRTRAQMPGKPEGRALLSEATLMLLDKGNITRQYVEQFMTLENLNADQLIEVTSMDLLIDFARIDLGIACVIREFVEEELKSGTLIQLRMPASIPPRTVGFAYLKNAVLSPSMEKFISFYKEHAL